MYKQHLKNLGLNDFETEIYYFLVQNGQSVFTQITKNLQFNNTTTNNTLINLQNQKLIKKNEVGNKFYYEVTAPENLAQFVYNQEATLNQKKEAYAGIIQQLQIVHQSVKENYPTIKFWQGESGLKEYWQTLGKQKTKTIKQIVNHDSELWLKNHKDELKYFSGDVKIETIYIGAEKMLNLPVTHDYYFASLSDFGGLIAQMLISDQQVLWLIDNESLKAISIEDQAIVSSMQVLFDNLKKNLSAKL